MKEIDNIPKVIEVDKYGEIIVIWNLKPEQRSEMIYEAHDDIYRDGAGVYTPASAPGEGLGAAEAA